MPFVIATELGLRTTSVYLSADSLEHINKDHRDITDVDLLRLPLMIRDGLLIRESKKPHMLIANYLDSHINRRYVASLKVKAAECEVWICSVYRCRKRQTSAHLKRGTILRKHR